MNSEEKPTTDQEQAPRVDEILDEETDTPADAEPFAQNETISDSLQQGELDLLKKQVEDYQQKYLRAQADFDNFRRRARTEKEELLKYASLQIIESLLPIMDNFERALSSSKDTKDIDALVKGLDMVNRQFAQVMEQEGVKAIQAVGQPFNPMYHEAIMQVESEEYESGTVVEEVVKGYVMKDKVIRPAMVRVSS